MEKANDQEYKGKNNNRRIQLVDSKDLFKGGKEIVIRHGNKSYTLKITRAGKLILN